MEINFTKVMNRIYAENINDHRAIFNVFDNLKLYVRIELDDHSGIGSVKSGADIGEVSA